MMDWHDQVGDAPAIYQAFLVPALFAPFAERLVEQAGVEPGSRVLDVACGTGAASRAAARRAGPGGSVTGVDLGEPTLLIARSQPADEGAAPIAYRAADAAALPLEDRAFDVAICQQGLQFFPDRSGALAELRRVLKPGGRLAVATWKDIERSPLIAVADALARHLGPEAAQLMHSPFALADGAELTRLIAAAGFDAIERHDETIECTWASHPEFARLTLAAGPTAPLFESMPEQAQRAVIEEVAARLEPHATADGRLRMPITSNVALARA